MGTDAPCQQLGDVKGSHPKQNVRVTISRQYAHWENFSTGKRSAGPRPLEENVELRRSGELRGDFSADVFLTSGGTQQLKGSSPRETLGGRLQLLSPAPWDSGRERQGAAGSGSSRGIQGVDWKKEGGSDRVSDLHSRLKQKSRPISTAGCLSSGPEVYLCPV
ncbi:hypothetical protein EYF80_002717 [Liparis tanakae]|uniref:Uncharacterized protein n=1 Tax=Liparis tanakae TaxID=230148 RepID=A0A4Z2JCD0_9TELE|nr:hypothetical protein EYF80_002717 [Liparis tanakae]